MGDHYVPRYYLRGFTPAGRDVLWAYDKSEKRKFKTTTKNIANENNFYSAEVEQYLANEIEGPANPVLKGIREKNRPTDEERVLLTNYLVVMLKRVPQGKQLFKNTAPAVAQKMSARYNAELDIAALAEPDNADFIKKRRLEIATILQRYSEEPPKDIWLDLIPPELSPRVVEVIGNMTWTFLTFEQEPLFLTSDNPVFYFQSMGIGSRESEISFPISCHITLLATWKSDFREDFIAISKQLVKEINRRTAQNATRYVYGGYDEHWVLPFVTKGKWQLNRIG